SDCVRKFPDIIGIQQERKLLFQLQKQVERQKRKIEFESLEESELEFLDNAKIMLDSFIIMLPYELYNNIKEVLYRLNLIKSSYINSGGDLKEIFNKYNLLKSKFGELSKKADEHCIRNKSNKLSCDKKTAEWLLINNVNVWEKVSRNDSLFELDTLQKTYCESFVERQLTVFREHLADPNIKLIKLQGNIIIFSINNGRSFYPITFYITTKKFMEAIGCYCLYDSSYQYDKRDFEETTIENTKNNYEAVYRSYSAVLNRNGYDFVIEDKTEQAYWMRLPRDKAKNKWSNNTNQVEALYKKSNIKLLLHVFAPFLLKEESILEANFNLIITKMESGQAWITQREKNINEQIAKEARGLQKQREYINY
ncbi:MAG: hypothetical protein ACYDEX_19540, partial [Mobilitalea sp.]